MINANNNLIETKDLTPYEIQDGVFGATFNKNGESLFLRMELLTEVNRSSWSEFKRVSCRIANLNSRGILRTLVRLAGKSNYPNYDEVKEVTGFTNEEYITFTEKAISQKKKTENKIVRFLEANSTGINHMQIGFGSEKKYITYITKNVDFSIQNAYLTRGEDTLKNFIDLYSDILISVGSDFSPEHTFQNRGISRNPYWVFEGKYSGLSMLLHGFTGAVADKYFSEKKFMLVRPLSAMQRILKKSLLPGEGYVEHYGIEIDITNLEVQEDEDVEEPMNYIRIAALTRIYYQQFCLERVT